MASPEPSRTPTLSLPSVLPCDTPVVIPPVSFLLVSSYSQSNQTGQLSCNHPNINCGSVEIAQQFLTLRRVWESNPLKVSLAGLANLCLTVRPTLQSTQL